MSNGFPKYLIECLQKVTNVAARVVTFPVCYTRGGGGGVDSNIKKVGVLVVSLRGVNFRFWSRLGC